MSQFKTITQNPNYDVAGGVTDFDKIRIQSEDLVTVEVFYTGLDAEDLSVKVQQTLDSPSDANFNDVKDASNALIEKQLESADKSHTFNITGFNTDYARVIISDVGAVTTGTITKIIWRIQK